MDIMDWEVAEKGNEDRVLAALHVPKRLVEERENRWGHRIM